MMSRGSSQVRFLCRIWLNFCLVFIFNFRLSSYASWENKQESHSHSHSKQKLQAALVRNRILSNKLNTILRAIFLVSNCKNSSPFAFTCKCSRIASQQVKNTCLTKTSELNENLIDAECYRLKTADCQFADWRLQKESQRRASHHSTEWQSVLVATERMNHP